MYWLDDYSVAFIRDNTIGLYEKQQDLRKAFNKWDMTRQRKFLLGLSCGYDAPSMARDADTAIK